MIHIPSCAQQLNYNTVVCVVVANTKRNSVLKLARLYI